MKALSGFKEVDYHLHEKCKGDDFRESFVLHLAAFRERLKSNGRSHDLDEDEALLFLGGYIEGWNAHHQTIQPTVR